MLWRNIKGEGTSGEGIARLEEKEKQRINRITWRMLIWEANVIFKSPNKSSRVVQGLSRGDLRRATGSTKQTAVEEELQGVPTRGIRVLYQERTGGWGEVVERHGVGWGWGGSKQ